MAAINRITRATQESKGLEFLRRFSYYFQPQLH